MEERGWSFIYGGIGAFVVAVILSTAGQYYAEAWTDEAERDYSGTVYNQDYSPTSHGLGVALVATATWLGVLGIILVSAGTAIVIVFRRGTGTDSPE